MTPVHDKEAAVKYMTWDTDQWISYDDADTFAQKVEWADSVGFAGSLIWASDLGRRPTSTSLRVKYQVANSCR
jgi:chitinase